MLRTGKPLSVELGPGTWLCLLCLWSVSVCHIYDEDIFDIHLICYCHWSEHLGVVVL